MKALLKYSLFALAMLFFVSCSEDDDGPLGPSEDMLDRGEALKAFEHLNNVRQDPGSFSEEIGVDLSYVVARHTLEWNDILQKVAEDRAMDLAYRNYFAHTNPDGKAVNILLKEAGYDIPDNWVEDLANNYFESIAARRSGTQDIGGRTFINQLILDEGVPSLGHRKHLLGIDTDVEFNSTLIHCGIGLARHETSQYRNYICVLIAKPGGEITSFEIAPENID